MPRFQGSSLSEILHSKTRNLRLMTQHWNDDTFNDCPLLKSIQCLIQAPDFFDLGRVPLTTVSLHLKTHPRTVRLKPPKQPLPNLLKLDLLKMGHHHDDSLCASVAMLPNLEILRTTTFVSEFLEFSRLKVLQCDFANSDPIVLPPNLTQLECTCFLANLYDGMFPASLLKLKMILRYDVSNDFSVFPKSLFPEGLKLLDLGEKLCYRLESLPRGWLPPQLEILKLPGCTGKICDASIFPAKTLTTFSIGGSFSSQPVVNQFTKLTVFKCRFESLGGHVFTTVSSLCVDYSWFAQTHRVDVGLPFVLTLFPNTSSLKLKIGREVLCLESQVFFPKIKTLKLNGAVETGCDFAIFPSLESLMCPVDLFRGWIHATSPDSLLAAAHLRNLKLEFGSERNLWLFDQHSSYFAELTKKPSFRTLVLPRGILGANEIPEALRHFSFLGQSLGFLKLYFNC